MSTGHCIFWRRDTSDVLPSSVRRRYEPRSPAAATSRWRQVVRPFDPALPTSDHYPDGHVRVWRLPSPRRHRCPAGTPEAEPVLSGAGADRPERAAFAPPIRSAMEIRMNYITPPPEPLIREIPLSCLALAPENVRQTPANEFAQAELKASIAAHGLLENMVARTDDSGTDGNERFAVVAGGRCRGAQGARRRRRARRRSSRALPDRGQRHCRRALASGERHPHRHAPADQVVAFSKLAESGVTLAAFAARLGVTERLVEQRHRLGNAAPELLDASCPGHRPRDAEGVRAHHRP